MFDNVLMPDDIKAFRQYHYSISEVLSEEAALDLEIDKWIVNFNVVRSLVYHHIFSHDN